MRSVVLRVSQLLRMGSVSRGFLRLGNGFFPALPYFMQAKTYGAAHADPSFSHTAVTWCACLEAPTS